MKKVIHAIISVVLISVLAIIGVVAFRLFIFPQKTLQEQIVKITVNPPAQDIGELMLSEVAESVEYVPLQTTDSNLIGNVNIFDVSSNYIVVLCSKTSIVYLFKRNGEFISQIGSPGLGPEEYPPKQVGSLFIDEDNKQILIQCNSPSRFMIYNLISGKHEKNISLDESTGKFLRKQDNAFLVSTKNVDGNVPYVYEIRARDFNLMNEQIKTVAFETMGSGKTMFPAPINYEYKGRIQTKERTLNDTIYGLDKDVILKPIYTLNAGNYEVTTELRGDAVNSFNRIPNYVVFLSIAETKNNLLFSYVYQRKDIFDYYDKTKQKTYHLSSEKGIPNDYDGGIDYWPQRQDNDLWYAFVHAHQFEEQMELQKKLTPKGSQQAVEKYNTMLKKLAPDDNPVLVIVKLKE